MKVHVDGQRRGRGIAVLGCDDVEPVNLLAIADVVDIEVVFHGVDRVQVELVYRCRAAQHEGTPGPDRQAADTGLAMRRPVNGDAVGV